jgi:hypothetical protein
VVEKTQQQTQIPQTTTKKQSRMAKTNGRILVLATIFVSGISADLNQNNVVSMLTAGGTVFVPRGNHFCDDGARIEIRKALAVSPEAAVEAEARPSEEVAAALDGRIEQTSRIWGRWNMEPSSNGIIEKLALCWETVGGYEATISVSAGPWVFQGCGIVCGGGVCIKASDGAMINATDSRIGGLGYGPRPYASVGLIAWSAEKSISTCTLVECKFSHILTHTGRFLKGSTGIVQRCSQSNCRKGLAASSTAKLVVDSKQLGSKAFMRGQSQFQETVEDRGQNAGQSNGNTAK